MERLMSETAPGTAFLIRHWLIRLLVIPLAVGCTALPARGASFDCTKAGTWIEQLVCEDETLGRLDERLAEAYRAIRDAAQSDAAALDRLSSRQQAWLAERDGCKLTPCITRLYEQRLAELGEPSTPPRGVPLEQQRIQETGPHFSIEAVYPVLTGDGPVVAKANQEIRALVDQVVGTFRGQIAEYDAEPPEVPTDGGDRGEEARGWEGPDWSLGIDYGSPYQTDRFLAIPFSGYEYTGGAHGMSLILPLVIDLATGQPIAPEGLFLPGSPWLERLSERCFAGLRGRELLSADTEWLREGTAPTAENYALLFPGPEGLTVTFPPYSVAPYAAGIQEVLIPYGDLAGLLSPALFGDPAEPQGGSGSIRPTQAGKHKI